MSEMSFGTTAGRMSGGAVVWAVHFVVIYGYTGLACARRFEIFGAALVALVPWVIGVATLAGFAISLMLIVPVLRSEQRIDFTQWMGAGVAAFALAAMLLEAMSVLWVPVCG